MQKLSRWSFAVTLIAVAFGAGVADAQTEKQAGTSAPAYRAKQILGSKVTLQDNMSAGVVDDIVLDDNGNVDYLIVANADNRLVTVPWDAAKFNVEKRMATLHIAPEKFQKVPTYTTQQYPVFTAPAYRTQVYEYYGLTPAQERRAIRRGVAP